MPLHRGRIQAQGGGLEKSVKWSKETPLTVGEGLALLNQLVEMLTPTEREERRTAIERQRNKMRRISQYGGVDHPQGWSEPPHAERRIDVEVKYGRAFVPD